MLWHAFRHATSPEVEHDHGNDGVGANSHNAATFGETFGTFWLVLGGCGSAVFAATVQTNDGTLVGIGFLGVALAFGLTVLTGVYAFGTVSGGHFNPAVTLGAAIARRIE